MKPFHPRYELIPPGLSLRRAWSDPQKPTAGFWWIEQLQGAAVMHLGSAWVVVSPLGEQRVNRELERCGLRGRRWSSRREALDAVALACQITEPDLGER